MTVSVILPVRDPTADQLKTAISSVLAQSYRDFELIVCDDGSEPSVKETVSSYGDPRIVYLRNEKNMGCAYSLNRCIRAAKGELLIRQDADDYSLPDRFSEIVNTYKETNYDIIGSNIILFDENSEWGRRDYPEFPQKKDFLFAVPFMHGACALKKSAVEAAGMYPVSDRTARCEDYALFMEMYAQGAKGCNIRRRLYAFREDEAAVKRRKYSDKIKEVRVKAHGFKILKLYPIGIVYLFKPLIVGLIPPKLLAGIKNKVFKRKNKDLFQ